QRLYECGVCYKDVHGGSGGGSSGFGGDWR
ncbi:hypothetical protein A2U01_0110129, partial [Trifolium medium]|nr:hypothetical protein [Trifolium medium]